MAVSESILWRVYAGVLGAATTVMTKKLVTTVWEASTGDEPPDPNDPETPLTHALLWAAASGLGVGVAQITMNRFMQRRWMATTGHYASKKLDNKLDLKKT